jgi:hypothetical protein
MDSMQRLRGAFFAVAASGALLLASCGGGGGAPAAPAPPPPPRSVTVTKIAVAPNPSGLKFGFFEVYNQQEATLALAGHRPLARAGYEHWAAGEPSPGTYAFPSLATCMTTHAYGEQLVASVAISYTEALSKLHTTIPAFYPQDITDPTTRAAAKKYLYAYVQALLQAVGPVTLTIDNEMVSNWGLDDPDADAPARGATWGAWYLEAAATARQAAADIGMSSALRLQPIVNGYPFTPGNPIALGPAHNQWLVDAVAASDGLAVDTYHSDPAQAVTDPEITIDTLAFWIDNYAAGKPVMMTENGFTTITQQDPGITRVQRQMKFTGTERDQADYYAALLPAVQAANAPGGLFHNQLRAFSFWSNIDNPHAPDEDSIYFGLVRLDGSWKPAATVVADAIAKIESSAFDAPVKAVDDGVDVTGAIGAGVALEFADGDRHDLLRVIDTQLPAGAGCHVRGSLAAPGSLVVGVNGSWTQVDLEAGPFDVAFPPATCVAGASNVADLVATGARYPFSQVVSGLALSAD